MKRAVLIVFCLALATSPAFAADAPKVTGVESLDAAFTKAILAGNAAALAALYADDAVLAMPGMPAARGGKAIAELIAGLVKDVKVTEFVLTDSRFETSGNLSAGWGRYKMTTVPRVGGAPTTEFGTYCGVATLKGGVWKYVSDNAAADPAPPAPPAKK
jgi:ketosteroid isomerase-like protein